jgi:hypothetical protein
MRIICALVVSSLAQVPVFSYPCSPDSPLGQLSFLVGEWAGHPQNTPITGLGMPGVLQSGDFTARYDLRSWVLTIRSRDVRSTSSVQRTGKGLVEDMMIVYSGCGSEHGTGAIYISTPMNTVQHCTFEVLYAPNRSKANGVTFVSLPEPNLMSFRLTYREIKSGTLGVELRVGSTTYISTARRRSTHASVP